LFSCKKKNSIKHEDSCVISTQQKIIVIQPYSDLDKSQVEYLVAEIKKVCPKVAVNKPIPLPSSAYYLANKRFRADSIIAIQMDKNGNQAWMNHIPKSQFFNSLTAYIYYSTMVTKDKTSV